MAAALAAVVTALCGLLPPIALAVVGWVQTPDLGLWPVISTGLRGWLLAHGAGVPLGGATITLVPLGVTAVALLTGSGLAGLAAHRARDEADLELSQRQRRSLTLRVAGAFTAAYLLCVLLAAAISDAGSQTGRALLGGIGVGAVSSLVGAGRALDWHPTRGWPGWARAVPRAVASALLVMVTTGAVVAAIALLQHRDQVAELHRALAPTTAGSVVLLLVQLAWLPNLVLWCASWALGAGFSIGSGSVVSPAHNLTGMLPAVPVFGAVPPNGPGPQLALLWLLSGVVAGVVAAVVIVRSRHAAHLVGQARLDESTLVGGLSGILAGLAFWVLAALSNGDLGGQRLVGVGARLVPLAVMAPTVMGISGLAAGLVLGLLGRRGAAGAATVDAASQPGTTPTAQATAESPDKSTMLSSSGPSGLGAHPAAPPAERERREDEPSGRPPEPTGGAGPRPGAASDPEADPA